MMELLLILAALVLLAKPLGVYMAMVYSGRRSLLSPVLGPVERGVYRLLAVDTADEMSWPRYATAMLLFSCMGFSLLYTLLLLQGYGPFNPDHLPALEPHLAFNIALSFITNTNWQSYTGEAALSPFSQTVGLAVQQFASCATGMAVAVALCRAFARKLTPTIGNFWVDLTRGVLYILLPLALLYACVLVFSGVPQMVDASLDIRTLEGNTQTLVSGPVASMEAIKQLGTNGGGFFATNSAHPFENPTPLTNMLGLLTVLLLPVAFVYAFGVLSGHRAQALTFYVAIVCMVTPLFLVALAQESQVAPAVAALGVDDTLGNMEGKEVRIGALHAAAWSVAATITGNGSANAANGSFMPLSTLQLLLPMMLGEITFGGVGSGMVSLLMFVLVTVFIGGLMVGRTPELMGKKLGAFEVKLASLIVVIPATIVLVGTALAVLTEAGRAGAAGHGIHGFTEILYAFSSAAANNGSGMAGLASNTPFYNVALGVAMFMGRYFILVSALAMAGALAAKNTLPMHPGTLPSRGPLFIVMLLIVVLLVGILNYVPALAMGPLAEHVLMGGIQ